jgi:hypothetical protein
MYVSCYTYKSLWRPFLKLKEKYIDKNLFTYFCTDEIKDFSIPNDNVKVLSFGEKSHFALNGNLYDRYLHYLNQINTKYILYFYDDMFPLSPVDTEKLNTLMYTMDSYDNIKLIKLSTHSFPFNHGMPVTIDGINYIKANNERDGYIMNVQPILIRRDFFIDLIKYCKIHNTLSYQNGGIEVYGTEFFKKNHNFICLRVAEDIVTVNHDWGIVQAGIISDDIKQMLKDKEDIEIETFENNLIYKLTSDEYNALGDHLKDIYRDKNIEIVEK